MDFEALYELLPKKTVTWTAEDTSKWLQFIHLSQLVPIFINTGVDGSCIHELDEEILIQQLQISSSVIRKKLLNWVKIGLNGYNNFITQSSSKMVDCIPHQFPLPMKKSETTHLRKQSKSKPMIQQNEQEQCEQQHLLLEQFEGNSLGLHIIKNEIMSIGFGKNNHIHSLETSISERHALIGKKNGQFFIQDLGSKYGTYIKINQRTPLRMNMILEIGSFQFIVIEMNEQKKKLKLKKIYINVEQPLQENNKFSQNIEHLDEKKIIKKPSMLSIENGRLMVSGINKSEENYEILQVDLNAKQKFTFGRKKQNDFQRDDKHMSGMHCKIIFFDNNFCIEDYHSTNGTWQRLSHENTISKQFPIENDALIKLGTAITYICRISSNKKKNKKRVQSSEQMKDENMCSKCQKSENNCLFLPCSHNISCIECGEKSKQCWQCGRLILQKVKIHK